MASSFSVSSEENSIPYWSPDSQFLLLDSLHSLTLIHIANKQQQMLLSDSHIPSASAANATILPDVNALLQPMLNSPWAADSRHFLFLTRGRFLWQGKSLSSGKGLYIVPIDNAGRSQSPPTVVDPGDDTQAGWTYEDPNSSFLF